MSRHLNIQGGASYNHAVLTANFCGDDPATGLFIPTCTDAFALANNGALKGQMLPYTPAFKGDLSARYTFPLMGWNAHVQGAVFYQSMAFAALKNGVRFDIGTMPGYATADFSVGAEHNNLTVELFVKNAFDSRGETNRSTPCTTNICANPGGYPAANAPAAVYVTTIQPLTVGIKLAQKF